MRKLVFILALLVSPAVAQTGLKDLTLAGTLNQIRSGAILTVANGGTFLAASGSTVDLSLATLSLPARYSIPALTGQSGKRLSTNGTILTWEPAGSGSGDLIASNNLSDVANTTTAFNNLAGVTSTSFGRSTLSLADAAAGRSAFGVVIGTNVQAYDAALAALAGKSTTGSANIVLSDNPTLAGFTVSTGNNGTFAGGTLNWNTNDELKIAKNGSGTTGAAWVLATFRGHSSTNGDAANVGITLKNSSGADQTLAWLRGTLLDNTAGAENAAVSLLAKTGGSMMSVLYGTNAALTIYGNLTASGTGTHSLAGPLYVSSNSGGQLADLASGSTTGVYQKFRTSAGTKGFIGTADQLTGGGVDAFGLEAPAGTVFLSTAGTPRVTANATTVTLAGNAAISGNITATGTGSHTLSGKLVANITGGGEGTNIVSSNTTGVYSSYRTSLNAKGFVGTADQLTGGSVDAFGIDASQGTAFIATAGTVRLTANSTAVAVAGNISATGSITAAGANVLTANNTETVSNKTISGASNTLTVRLANDVSGTLPVANGGTGLTTYTSGGLVYASGTGTLASSGALTGYVKGNGASAPTASSTIPASDVTAIPDVWVVACSDETTALTTGTAKVTFRAPFAATVTAVRATLTTAQASGSIFTVDINESGTSILSTKLTIDNTEKTSFTAATAPVISDTSLANDAEITVDIDQVGASGATGLKVYVYVTR